LNDTQWRISAGRAPSSASLELRSLVLNREMELARSQQALNEAQAKVLSALHAARGSDASIAATPRILTVDAKLDQTPPALGTALESWPPYQLALVRQEQSQVRLSFAKNQRLPNLDLIAGYNGTGLGYRGIDEIGPIAQQFSYPDWYIAVNFEIPLGGGRKTKQQMAAQEERSRQSNIDLEAIRSALANDLPVRLEDLHNARTVLRLSQSEISVRKDIVTNEQQRIQLGSGSISNLIQKQIDWIDARQRGIENQLRYEIAYASWLYSKGFLLKDYGIDIEIE
jgi:outer membrane protein TolC